ncbi:hypothetical protein OU814_27510 [Leptolyngbya sp. GGD]|nr:hypothetical protein [Leptolyngbya sp. GGD]MCY6493921.1 hypothetical protein [Leptolyngbya sp. GGD]
MMPLEMELRARGRSRTSISLRVSSLIRVWAITTYGRDITIPQLGS